jgi:hypothetical protein
MSVAPYVGIPTRDTQLATWAQVFADAINAAPSTYGLSLTDASNIVTANDNFQAAFATATDPSTRSRTTVAAKDSYKNAAVATFRSYYIIIQANPGVTDDNKLAAGVRIRSQSHHKRLCPQTQPLLAILGAIPLQLQCRFQDPDRPTARGRLAPNAVSVQFWAEVSTTPTNLVSNAHFLGDFTRNIVQLNFDPGDVGKTAVIWCRWAGKTWRHRAMVKCGEDDDSGDVISLPLTLAPPLTKERLGGVYWRCKPPLTPPS